jgi:adenylosuccinate synthase
MSCVIVLGAQWGDEGKGKVVDMLAPASRAVVRFQGGANAGHTVIAGGAKHVLHQLPSGVLTGGCVGVIAAGCVVDLEALRDEIRELAGRGVEVTRERLVISGEAHVVTPLHRLRDRLEGGGVGTTGRGIGPAYADKMRRVGIRVESVADGTFGSLLRCHLEEGLAELRGVRSRVTMDVEEVAAGQEAAARELAWFVGDAAGLVEGLVRGGENVLFEGAQGTMLDIDHGTYPYVTSSSASVGGALASCGVYVEFVRRIGVLKAYATRVGNGPFPTELHGEEGERLRGLGAEFGATTGRPRRCGWLDLHLLRQAVVANGFNVLALNKLDVLAGLDEVKVASGRDGAGQPVYRAFGGWRGAELAGCRRYEELPLECRAYVGYIEETLGVPVGLLSTGPEREHCIVRRPTW